MHVECSERLHYQFITRDDANFLFEIDQDVAVMRYINGGSPTSMKKIHSVAIPRLKSYANKDRGWGQWKVSIRAAQGSLENTGIGWILVRPMDFFSSSPQWHNLEIGWRFKRSSWGSGYSTEAAKAVIKALNKKTEVQIISGLTLRENGASIKIMNKLGMTFLKRGSHRDQLGNRELVYYAKRLR